MADWTSEYGYHDYVEFPNGNNACIHQLMFTWAILSELTDVMYGDRWCYHSYEAAKEALDAWCGEGEPTGWHRHPSTGRRRENGDPSKEKINW
jgi:hypothetical protein